MTHLQEKHLHEYPDEELILSIEAAPSIVTTREEAVKFLSPKFIAKPCGMNDPLDEARAIDLARSIGIKAPLVRRVVPGRFNESWLVMDRVPGSTLEQLWPNMSWWTTFRVARQLRGYLSCMHNVTSQSTGGVYSGKVNSEFLQGVYQPVRHATPAQFTAYLNWWLTECRRGYLNSLPQLLLSPPKHHVFVHQDLAPRNMILDDRGSLWMIDWGHAGFYPEYMEYVGIETTAMPWIRERTWSAWWARLKWAFFRWVAAGPVGPHEKPKQVLEVVESRSLRWRLDEPVFSVSE